MPSSGDIIGIATTQNMTVTGILLVFCIYMVWKEHKNSEKFDKYDKLTEQVKEVVSEIRRSNDIRERENEYIYSRFSDIQGKIDEVADTVKFSNGGSRYNGYYQANPYFMNEGVKRSDDAKNSPL